MSDDPKDALLLDDDRPVVSPEDAAVYELMDSDEDVRRAVAQEIKARLFQPQQQVAAPAPLPGSDELKRVEARINELESFVDGFYNTPDTEKDYVAYQKAQDELRRLERTTRQLEGQQRVIMNNLNQSSAWVDEWISEQVQEQKARRGGASTIDRYAATIRELAGRLDANVRADKGKLRDALRYYIEPNAYKQHNENRNARDRANIRRDSGSYSEPGDEGAPVTGKQDKYADASPEEREFLKNVGLLKTPAKQSSTELIPFENGYIIPIGRGRRNARRDDEQ